MAEMKVGYLAEMRVGLMVGGLVANLVGYSVEMTVGAKAVGLVAKLVAWLVLMMAELMVGT